MIAKYIYHDYDPKLPTLAVIVLQKLCAVSITLHTSLKTNSYIYFVAKPIANAKSPGSSKKLNSKLFCILIN